ncbi:MAG: hypothetical protein ABI380_06120, partial [Edaphobacter sp.]
EIVVWNFFGTKGRLTAAEEAGLYGHLSWRVVVFTVAASLDGLCMTEDIAQWCLPLRRQQARIFASTGDAAKSGETSESVNSSSNEMEMKRRTGDLIGSWLGRS